MKFFFRNSDRRAELSALVTIAIVLAIVAAAKLDAVTSLFSTPLADFAEALADRRATSFGQLFSGLDAWLGSCRG